MASLWNRIHLEYVINVISEWYIKESSIGQLIFKTFFTQKFFPVNSQKEKKIFHGISLFEDVIYIFY